MPAHVQDWVADELGSPVVSGADQVGGMSPGCATRLVCEDGTRAFVKAVGAELNPRTPDLFRREVTALTLIGSHELWADLRGSYDDGDWVALLLEDVEGTHPDLDDDATMDTLLRPISTGRRITCGFRSCSKNRSGARRSPAPGSCRKRSAAAASTTRAPVTMSAGMAC
jgi:hypothetical protein